MLDLLSAKNLRLLINVLTAVVAIGSIFVDSDFFLQHPKLLAGTLTLVAIANELLGRLPKPPVAALLLAALLIGAQSGCTAQPGKVYGPQQHDAPCNAEPAKPATCPCPADCCGWRRGPLPPNTFMWGGVVLVGEGTNAFHFADFYGDHVRLPCANGREPRIVKPHEVAFYNNSLTWPLPKELCP